MALDDRSMSEELMRATTIACETSFVKASQSICAGAGLVLTEAGCSHSGIIKEPKRQRIGLMRTWFSSGLHNQEKAEEKEDIPPVQRLGAPDRPLRVIDTAVVLEHCTGLIRMRVIMHLLEQVHKSSIEKTVTVRITRNMHKQAPRIRIVIGHRQTRFDHA